MPASTIDAVSAFAAVERFVFAATDHEIGVISAADLLDIAKRIDKSPTVLNQSGR